MGLKIKDIYKITFDIADIDGNDRCPMHDWYADLINKTYSELDLFDVTRMLIQKMFLELAVSRSIDFMAENLFCGQRYEGELLELLSRLDKGELESHREELLKILDRALEENIVYDWLSEEERNEFEELIHSFNYNLQKSE